MRKPQFQSPRGAVGRIKFVAATLFAVTVFSGLSATPSSAKIAAPTPAPVGNLSQIPQRLSALEAGFSNLQNTVNAQNAQIAAQNAQIAALQNTVNTQNAQVAALQTSVTSLQNTVAAQNTQITALQTTTTNQGNQITTLQNTVAAQGTTIAAQQVKLAPVTVSGTDYTISGFNVRIVDGGGDTSSTSGLGNLTIGYNRLRNNGTDDRTGSHNLILGDQNNYSSFGGLVGGLANTSSGVYASVLGGFGSTASGFYSSVSGGARNRASSDFSSVSGGANNTASGDSSSVSGGSNRTAGGNLNWVAGALFQDS